MSCLFRPPGGGHYTGTSLTPFADYEVANAEPIAAMRAVGTARQSALALPRGKAAATARFLTETRIIRGRKLLEGIGLLSFTAFLFALEKADAAGPDIAFTDDGKITLKDLEHGSFELITKEANPRHIIVDNPEQTIILRYGSAGIAVEQVTNPPAELVRLQAAQQEVLLTYAYGRATQAGPMAAPAVPAPVSILGCRRSTLTRR